MGKNRLRTGPPLDIDGILQRSDQERAAANTHHPYGTPWGYNSVTEPTGRERPAHLRPVGSTPHNPNTSARGRKAQRAVKVTKKKVGKKTPSKS